MTYASNIRAGNRHQLYIFVCCMIWYLVFGVIWDHLYLESLVFGITCIWDHLYLESLVFGIYL